MNYTMKSVKIKSQWFDVPKRKKSTYQKIGYRGLNLYFQIYKFRLHNQENEHTFITSISMLRKETGYTTQEIYELLKVLKGAKVIKLTNTSRWDYLLDAEGNILDKNILVIEAIDTPITERRTKEENGKLIKNINNEVMYFDFPVDENNYYISVSFEMLKHYENKGLNERYYALYCLMVKYRNGHEDNKMNMRISKIADLLLMDKDTIHRMIYTMNRHYLLASYHKKRKADYGTMFEHYILPTLSKDTVEEFMDKHKATMDKITKIADNKKNKKKTEDIEQLLEQEAITIEEEEAIQLDNSYIDTIRVQYDSPKLDSEISLAATSYSNNDIAKYF
ncbi:hypothetical protein [Bacillus massiliigorillae]|uniref:hypothetical protein n=1 Tax=Bacillus massiliigorillae TaxID=1243664 RepID=UPI0003A9FB2C|nr:hypothetical protein [Bacillus massiliigorillae]